MGIQALVLFIGLTIALTVGVLAGMSEATAPFAGWLVIGLFPVMSALWYLTERAIGREIFHYTAAYPSRRDVAAVIDASRPQTAAEREPTVVDAEEIRLAA